ncbi:hypothetical protein SAMN05216298_4942 [Glycomyces sambucus]|uniref:Uncharacterized protein n=1 Tax=Glycomyces sambucus TaxID=380244 RepID=A0A1G9MG45_9ACTN|nr:hypothetical protein SAMN05216298_4942 [Glycomyces sambucus]
MLPYSLSAGRSFAGPASQVASATAPAALSEVRSHLRRSLLRLLREIPISRLCQPRFDFVSPDRRTRGVIDQVPVPS